MGVFRPSQGSNSQGIRRDRDNHFACFYLISCPVSILLICAEVDVAELGTDL